MLHVLGFVLNFPLAREHLIIVLTSHTGTTTFEPESVPSYKRFGGKKSKIFLQIVLRLGETSGDAGVGGNKDVANRGR